MNLKKNRESKNNNKQTTAFNRNEYEQQLYLWDANEMLNEIFMVALCAGHCKIIFDITTRLDVV